MFAASYAQSARKNTKPQINKPQNNKPQNAPNDGPEEDSDISSDANAILTDMNSTITDVRGANGAQHGTGNMTKTSCLRGFAQSNIINSHNHDLLREAGMYGEEVLSQGRDHAEIRGTKCKHPRANNTVKCVRELVDEGSKTLSPQEQLEEDRHLLTDYILDASQ